MARSLCLAPAAPLRLPCHAWPAAMCRPPRCQRHALGPREKPLGLSNIITVLVILTMSSLQVLRREVAPLGTIGVIASNFLAKALKLLVKSSCPRSLWQRPEGSTREKSDPGFPSSHTSNMTFISAPRAVDLEGFLISTVVCFKWTQSCE